MLKNDTVAITRHKEEAIVKLPSDGICPLVQDLINLCLYACWMGRFGQIYL